MQLHSLILRSCHFSKTLQFMYFIPNSIIRFSQHGIISFTLLFQYQHNDRGGICFFQFNYTTIQGYVHKKIFSVEDT